MDITHYGGNYFLTLISCWSPVLRFGDHWHDKTRQLSYVFYERGTPEKILADNGTAFCSQQARRFLSEWGVRLRSAYVPSGIDITERSHHSVKRIAAHHRGDNVLVQCYAEGQRVPGNRTRIWHLYVPGWSKGNLTFCSHLTTRRYAGYML